VARAVGAGLGGIAETRAIPVRSQEGDSAALQGRGMGLGVIAATRLITGGFLAAAIGKAARRRQKSPLTGFL